MRNQVEEEMEEEVEEEEGTTVENVSVENDNDENRGIDGGGDVFGDSAQQTNNVNDSATNAVDTAAASTTSAEDYDELEESGDSRTRKSYFKTKLIGELKMKFLEKVDEYVSKITHKEGNSRIEIENQFHSVINFFFRFLWQTKRTQPNLPLTEITFVTLFTKDEIVIDFLNWKNSLKPLAASTVNIYFILSLLK